MQQKQKARSSQRGLLHLQHNTTHTQLAARAADPGMNQTAQPQPTGSGCRTCHKTSPPNQWFGLHHLPVTLHYTARKEERCNWHQCHLHSSKRMVRAAEPATKHTPEPMVRVASPASNTTLRSPKRRAATPGTHKNSTAPPNGSDWSTNTMQANRGLLHPRVAAPGVVGTAPPTEEAEIHGTQPIISPGRGL